jgi:polysaccharide pyruvyl transferase WcaK-like protein
VQHQAAAGQPLTEQDVVRPFVVVMMGSKMSKGDSPELAFKNYGDQLMYLTITAMCESWGVECAITNNPHAFADAFKRLQGAKKRAAGVFFLQGFYFGDQFNHIAGAEEAIVLLKWCRLEGLFSAMLPQAGGPFSPKKPLRKHVAKMYPLIDRIYLRDAAAIAAVSELEGVVTPLLVQDTVFSGYRPLLLHAQTIRDLPHICLSVSHKMKSQSGKSFDTTVKSLISKLTSNATLLLIPHEDGCEECDRDLCRRIWQSMTKAGNTRTIFLDVPSIQVAKVEEAIAKCDVMVTMRYHALILAARDATPVVAFSWAPKYADLLGRLGLDESRSIVSLKNLDETVRKVWAVYDNRTLIAADMRERVAAISQRVDDAYSQLREPLFAAFNRRNGLPTGTDRAPGLSTLTEEWAPRQGVCILAPTYSVNTSCWSLGPKRHRLTTKWFGVWVWVCCVFVDGVMHCQQARQRRKTRSNYLNRAQVLVG